MSHLAKVATAVTFDNDKVSRANLKSGVVVDEVDVGTGTLEPYLKEPAIGATESTRNRIRIACLRNLGDDRVGMCGRDSRGVDCTRGGTVTCKVGRNFEVVLLLW